MTIDPAAPSLRSRTEVRASVDEAWEGAEGLQIVEVFEQLSNPERVEWFLGEFLVCLLDHRFHIWIQRFVDPGVEGIDGPALLAAIAEVARPLDSELADLLRWCAERGAAVQDGTGGEALFSVVPLVWSAVWEGRVPEFAYALVERWPEDLDPRALEAPPWMREVVEPQEGEGPRYPSCRVAYTDQAVGCDFKAPPNPTGISETTAYALWRAGASDAELNAFYFGGETGSPAHAARWILFDGDGGTPERIAALQESFDVLAQILGIDSSRGKLVVRVPVERLEPLQAELREAGASSIHVQASEDRPWLAILRSGLRMDPDLFLIDAKDVVSEQEAETLIAVIETGHLVVLGGESPGVAGVLESFAHLPTEAPRVVEGR